MLGLADDALVSAQRLGWWISRAPELEEDVALANIGLDQLGQARTLLALRRPGSRATAAARTTWPTGATSATSATCTSSSGRRPTSAWPWPGCWCSPRYQAELYAALLGSADETLAGVAGKAVKEVAYHVDHAHHWVVRLGDGTDESHARMQAALDAEWPYVEELFTPVDPALVGAGIAVDPTAFRTAVLERVAKVLDEATLAAPEVTPGSAAAAAACTPSTSATSSPRCSTSHARTRERRGEHRNASQPGLGAGRRGPRPGDPRRHHRGPRHPA